MSILNILKGLVPSFGKKDIREKLRVIASKIAELVLPALDSFAETLNERQLKSKYGKDLIAAVYGFLPPVLRNSPTPYAKVVRTALENATKLLEGLQDYTGKHLGDAVHVEGLTYQKASVLRLIELIDFFQDYTLRQLTFLVASEVNIEAFDRQDGNPFTQAELKFLQTNQGAWLKMLELLNGDPKQALSALEKVPEVLLSDADANEVPALGGTSADPLKLGFIPGVSHIFHWVGLRLVDWEIERYERAKKEKRDIEMRLEALRQRRGGTVDARTESIIANYERELTLARAKIANMEDKVR